MFNSRKWVIIVTLLSAFIFFFNLGGMPLLDPDEPVYAETPNEMLQFNDLISPRIYGEYWYDKPPMYYWLVAGAFKVFGVNEFAARFPSALLGVLGVLSVYQAGSRLFSPRAGFFSALILTTSLEYFYLAKAAVTDITLTLLLTISLLAFMQKKYYWYYLFAGLAFVTKGPIGFLFPAGIVFFYLLLTKRWTELLKMKVPLGIVLFSVVAFPWYTIMYSIHGAAFIDTFFGFHNITRFTSPEHPGSAVWYYFIPVLVLGFFPWTSVIVQSVRNSFRACKMERSSLWFLIIWATFIFLFFTVSQTKLVSYILPMYPPIALLVGWYVDLLCSNRFHKTKAYGWATILTFLVAGLLVIFYFGVQYIPEVSVYFMMLAAVLVMMLLLVWHYLLQTKILHAFTTQVVAMSLFAMILVGLIFPTIAPRFSSREIANAFVYQYDGQSEIFVAKFLRPGFAYYSNFYGKSYDGKEQLFTALKHEGKTYYVVTEQDYSFVVSQSIPHQVLAQSANSVLFVKQ